MRGGATKAGETEALAALLVRPRWAAGVGVASATTLLYRTLERRGAAARAP